MAVLFVENVHSSMQDPDKLLEYFEFILRILAGTTEHRCKEDDTPHRHRARARETQHNAARTAAITEQTQALAHMPRNRTPLRGGLRMLQNRIPAHRVPLPRGPLLRPRDTRQARGPRQLEAPTCPDLTEAPARRLHAAPLLPGAPLRGAPAAAMPQRRGARPASSRHVRHRVRAAPVPMTGI